MGVFKQLARVRLAEQQWIQARQQVVPPAADLLARGYRHPLSAMGAVAGIGVLLGRLGLPPLRVPALGGLLSGGLAELLGEAVHLLMAAAEPPAPPAEPPPPPSDAAS